MQKEYLDLESRISKELYVTMNKSPAHTTFQTISLLTCSMIPDIYANGLSHQR